MTGDASAAVHDVAAEEADAAIAALTLAFAGDPLTRWFFPDADVYLATFPAFVRAFGGRAFEHGTAYASQGCGGVALWLPEGVTSDQEAMRDLMLGAFPPERLAEVGEFGQQLEHFHTDEPHWYLPMIGVQPDRQGRGLGSTLLAHALARCDEHGLVAYLESSNAANVPLYRRHGFEVLGEIQVGTSPVVYPMQRPARAGR